MMFNSKNYLLDSQYRSQQMKNADYGRLAQSGRDKELNRQTAHTKSVNYRWLVSAALITIVLFLLLMPARVSAQEMMDDRDDGFFAPIMADFRTGYYYYITEDYETAIDYYLDAINGFPQEVFEKSTMYAFMYQYLGDAQQAAGLDAEAQVSYQLYLQCAQTTADPNIVAMIEIHQHVTE